LKVFEILFGYSSLVYNYTKHSHAKFSIYVQSRCLADVVYRMRCRPYQWRILYYTSV